MSIVTGGMSCARVSVRHRSAHYVVIHRGVDALRSWLYPRLGALMSFVMRVIHW